ncbi:uncharacterized protein LOC113506444 [Trichoplusia ni]|uniref:Uncharacterized protein LOC113506444 n=1 Tax=Trichoplusia ni TaxID=7111 RepID=A0A7E5WW75_TRINI|nr:uncharacterized protein LOC113506444 [Trichoplusia ni]
MNNFSLTRTSQSTNLNTGSICKSSPSTFSVERASLMTSPNFSGRFFGLDARCTWRPGSADVSPCLVCWAALKARRCCATHIDRVPWYSATFVTLISTKNRPH